MGINLNASTNTKSDSIKQAKLYSRNLTTGEIALAKWVFKNHIDYSKVKIYFGNFLPNQDPYTFVTPNGNIYAPEDVYLEDYSVADLGSRKIFIHEMGHVWQYQSDTNVLVTGGVIHACAYFTDIDPYHYDIHELKAYKSTYMPNMLERLPKKLLDYNLEAQAEIIADYWLIKHANKQVQHMRDANKTKNVKGSWVSLIKIYEDKVKEVLP
jgi:hypothetical protein